MPENYGPYPIYIDGRWSLEDLYVFPRNYEQVYFSVQAIIASNDTEDEERIIRAFHAFPWQGGYSAVNFYNQLKFATSPSRRPVVASIRYASPGWIELVLDQHLAVQVGAIISSVAGSILICNKVYNTIYSDLQQRKLLRMEVELKKIKLSKEEIDFIVSSSQELSQLLGLPTAQIIHERTRDPLISLKILMSIYRRVRRIAEYVNRGKARFDQ